MGILSFLAGATVLLEALLLAFDIPPRFDKEHLSGRHSQSNTMCALIATLKAANSPERVQISGWRRAIDNHPGASEMAGIRWGQTNTSHAFRGECEDSYGFHR